MNRMLLELIRAAAERHHESLWFPTFSRRFIREAARTLQDRHRRKKMGRVLSGQTASLADINTFLRRHVVPMRAPLLLISQVQRSGGTLLSQLFDGHSALAAYPDELRLGHPKSDTWPQLDPACGQDKNFLQLYDSRFPRLVRRGFTKAGHEAERHRFFFVPRLQHSLFKHLFETVPPVTSREILDHFFTAHFNAWLNYQGSLERKRWITAFAPRLAHDRSSVARFFEGYPDGRLVQVLRDPRSWYPSAKRHSKSGLSDKAPCEILSLWCLSAESILRNKATYGEKVTVLRFEDLVGNTEQIMRALARELGIDYEPALAEPTFNGELMRANSSFAIERPGIFNAPLKRDETLTEEELTLIEKHCLITYEKALAVTLGVPRPV